MADLHLILGLLFLHLRGGCSLAVVLFFLVCMGLSWGSCSKILYYTFYMTFFSFNGQMHARYLAFFHVFLANIKISHPGAAHRMRKGSFSAKRLKIIFKY